MNRHQKILIVIASVKTHLFTAQVFKDAMAAVNLEDGFIGHIGGDDFVAIVSSECRERIPNARHTTVCLRLVQAPASCTNIRFVDSL